MSREARLDAGLQALGLDLSQAQRDLLLRYLEMLGKWNQVYNLTAVRDPNEMLTQHLLDSLAVVEPLRTGTALPPSGQSSASMSGSGTVRKRNR